MKIYLKKSVWGHLTVIFTFGCFGLSPQAQAVCQEGCLTNENAVLGDDALISNTGNFNTAMGFNALFSNTTGTFNTANGAFALFSNTTGSLNTAIGSDALYWNTTGNENTATGFNALESNTTGFNNTATGEDALASNTTGYDNMANGVQALLGNTTGYDNAATGGYALLSNTTGYENTADGVQALFNNTTGNGNTAEGNNALVGNTTGSNNIALGAGAGAALTIGSNNIYIGNAGRISAESNKIRIGTTGIQRDTFIAGISGVIVPGGVGVIVGTDGKLGTIGSSERFKDNIQPMDKASEAILALRPVTFRYKHELDPQGIPQFGLVAEDVQKVNPDLVARDDEGKLYTVRYEAVNAMLLNEFLKEHRKVEQQGAMIAKQQNQIEALTAGLQKVSDQLELSKAAPQTVLNNQ